MGADLIQEVAVVRDDDHGAGTVVQHVFQPADGVDIEVVGRFVQQQDIRIGEQRLCQQHAQLPAWSNGAHRAVVLVEWDADTEQQFAGARFRRVAVVFGVDVLQFGGAHIIVLGRLRVHVDGVLLDVGGPHLLMAHHDHIKHALVFVGELVLLEPCHTFVAVDGDVASRRLQHAGQNLHEGGLTATVGADQAVAVAFAEFDGDVLEQRLGAKLHGDVVSDEQNESLKILATESTEVTEKNQVPILWNLCALCG